MNHLVTPAEHWSRAEAFGDDFEGSPCMVLPMKPTSAGYVQIRCGGPKRMAHRVIYEALIGPILEGMTLDHRCAATNDLRSCVNPWHMEPVPIGVNVLRGRGPCAANLRKTTCKYGHPLTGENLLRIGRKRRCITCKRAAGLRQYHRGKASPG